MKVTPIFNHMPFRSNIQDDENVMGFDDEYSRQTREFIREHYNEYRMPYQSIYESEGRKTEYQLQALLRTLTNKPKKVDDETIMGLSVENLFRIGNNSYRGATLAGRPSLLKILKNAGVERVIDLVGYSEYQEDAENQGLEYYGFSMFEDIWNTSMFDSNKSVLRRAKREFELYYQDSEDEKEFLSRKEKEYLLEKRENIDDFITFIQTMQKGNLYIGCQFGTSVTQDALLLNSVFNPKAPEEELDIPVLFKIHSMQDLYKNLTDEDKKKMGWTEEFDKNFLPRLQIAEKHCSSYY